MEGPWRGVHPHHSELSIPHFPTNVPAQRFQLYYPSGIVTSHGVDMMRRSRANPGAFRPWERKVSDKACSGWSQDVDVKDPFPSRHRVKALGPRYHHAKMYRSVPRACNLVT